MISYSHLVFLTVNLALAYHINVYPGCLNMACLLFLSELVFNVAFDMRLGFAEYFDNITLKAVCVSLHLHHAVAKRYFLPPPADYYLPPLSGAGSLRWPKFVCRDTISSSLNLS